MIEKLFVQILNMSLTGSVVILCVLLARLLLRKAPSIFSYCLWAVVLFRLLCPVSFSSGFSLFGVVGNTNVVQGRMEYISNQPAAMGTDTEDGDTWQNGEKYAGANVGQADNFGTDVIEPSVQEQPAAEKQPATEVKRGMSFWKAAGLVWVLGIAGMVLYSVISLLELKRKLKTAVHAEDNIYQTPLFTPFVIGIFKPCIYLPATLKAEEKDYILLHEQVHIKRGDHIIKIVAFLVLCLHWFNPLVWAAFFLSGKDMEMSCDEAVLRKIGNTVKKEYSASLLSLATGRRIINGVPLAFGEGDTGSRIKNVLRYKKPAAFVLIIALVLCVAVGISLSANPKGGKAAETPTGDEQQMGQTGEQIFYGVVTDLDLEGQTRRVLSIPNVGYVEIPAAEQQTTLAIGDLVKVTLEAEEDLRMQIALQSVTPAKFPVDAKRIEVMGKDFRLQPVEEGWRLTLPCDAVPEMGRVAAGDTLHITEEADGQTQVLDKELLSVLREEDGAKLFTVQLSSEEAERVFKGFGTTVIFSVEKKQEEDIGVVSEDGVISEGSFYVNLRNILKETREADVYNIPDLEVDEKAGKLVFSSDCVFKVNFAIDKIEMEETDFATFADIINDGHAHLATPSLNQPCLLTFRNGVVVEAELSSAYLAYGVSYNTFGPEFWWYDDLVEIAGKDVLTEFYTLQNTIEADIAPGKGMETVEVYTGNIGDGDSGIVFYKDSQGRLLMSDGGHVSRAGWNNIYLGENEEGSYLLNVNIEDRWDYGSYSYYAYRLDGMGGTVPIAGSVFEWGDYYQYDDALFKQWADGLEYYLSHSRLIFSSQEGEIRTEDDGAYKYNYDTLCPAGREDEIG